MTLLIYFGDRYHLCCGAAAFMIYLLCLAPDITWIYGSSDSGELVTAAFHLGVAHPTGYPLYTLVGWSFSHLPLGAARAMNLLSALAGASAVALMALLAFKTTPAEGRSSKLLSGISAALLLAFSPLFWSLSTVTEVYSLSAALLLGVLLAQEHAALRPGDGAALVILGAAVGVAATHHSTSILLLPAIGLRLWLSWRMVLLQRPKLLLAAAGAAMAPLLLYLLLPLRSMTAPPFAVWDDLQSPAAFLGHITGAAYRGALFSLPLPVALARIPALVRLLLEQFGWVGCGLAIAGLWTMAYHHRRLVYWWVCAAALYLAFALEYPVQDSVVYLLPFFLLTALAAGWGLALLTMWAANQQRYARLGLAAAIFCGVAIPLASLVANFDRLNTSRNTEAVEYGAEVFATLPPDALIVTHEDRYTFTLWYFQHVVGLRPDVKVVDRRLLEWPWYQRRLRLEYPDLALPPLVRPLRELRDFVEANLQQRPVYATFGELPLEAVSEGRLFRVTGLNSGE